MSTINREDAITEIEKAMREDGFRSGTGLVHKAKVYEILRSLPDVKDIIHCKYCKHYWTHRCMDSMLTQLCDLHQTFYDPERDYCSLAERREDDSSHCNKDAIRKGNR